MKKHNSYRFSKGLSSDITINITLESEHNKNKGCYEKGYIRLQTKEFRGQYL